MRCLVVSVSLLMPIVFAACEREPEKKDETSPPETEVFLGAIPADFKNAASADEFRLAAGDQATKIEQALGGIGFSLTATRASTLGADPGLPTLDRCDDLSSVTGGFMSTSDLTSADGSLDPMDLQRLTCQQLARTLNASFYDLGLAAGTLLRRVTDNETRDDACTSTRTTPPTSERAAVGYELVRRSQGDGAYLAAYNLGDFTATLEGGAAGQAMALRSDAQVIVEPQTETGRRMQQKVSTAMLVDTALARVDAQKTERLEVIREGGQVSELTRRTVVTLAFGDTLQVQEETTFVRTPAGAAPETWTLNATATPGEGGNVAVDLKVTLSDGLIRRALVTCGASSP